jgi:hypothetical protein
MRRRNPESESESSAGALVVERDGRDLVAEVISGPVRGARGTTKIEGVVIGRLVRCTAGEAGGAFEVDHPENPEGRPLRAVATVALGEADVGCEVALAFESGDPRKPIVLGRIHRSPVSRPVEGQLDGETLTFTADKQIVLRCGKSSITLTRAGKILIRGAYLLSRSSGVNRIKGGSVQLN